MALTEKKRAPEKVFFSQESCEWPPSIRWPAILSRNEEKKPGKRIAPNRLTAHPGPEPAKVARSRRFSDGGGRPGYARCSSCPRLSTPDSRLGMPSPRRLVPPTASEITMNAVDAALARGASRAGGLSRPKAAMHIRRAEIPELTSRRPART